MELLLTLKRNQLTENSMIISQEIKSKIPYNVVFLFLHITPKEVKKKSLQEEPKRWRKL